MIDIIDINLAKVRTKNKFFDVMKEEFQLPSYFAYNLDSLDECMRDLSWFNYDTKIIFKNLDRVRDENLSLYETIKECVELYKDFWNKNVSTIREKSIKITIER